MSTTPLRRHRLGAAVLATSIAFLASTQAAWAVYGEDEEPDTGPLPEYVPRPDLFVSDASISKSSTGWQLSYTVKNNGDAPSGSFRVAFAKDGATSVGTRTEAGIAAKGARTSSVTLSRSTCYIALKLTVDDQKVVAEASEGNNTKWLVGQAEDVCADAPKYKVQAMRLKAVEQSHGDWGASDEPYLTISRVSNAGTGLTWETPVYENVFTGESVGIDPAHGCVWSRSCAAMAAPHGIGFSVQVMEHDSGDLTAVRNTVAEAFDKAGPIVYLLAGPEWAIYASPLMAGAVDTILGWFDDDVIGSQTYAFTPIDLAMRIPLPGQSFDDTRYYMGAESSADARYSVTMRFTRVA